jgi:hypothetical protein
LSNADAFFIGSRNRVVKPNALNEAAITAGALVSDNNVKKRTGLGSATGESNDDHD